MAGDSAVRSRSASSGRLANERTRRIATGDAHDAAARVTAGTAQVQPAQWRAILRGTRHRSHDEELVERQLSVMPVSAADAKLPLDVRRGQQLRGFDAGAQPACAALERLDDQIREARALVLPAGGKLIRSVLHHRR